MPDTSALQSDLVASNPLVIRQIAYGSCSTASQKGPSKVTVQQSGRVCRSVHEKVWYYAAEYTVGMACSRILVQTGPAKAAWEHVPGFTSVDVC